MRIGIFGNCQTASYLEVLKTMLPEENLIAILGNADTAPLLDCDKILVQNDYDGFFADHSPLSKVRDRVIKIPTFYFAGFHPDLIMETRRDGHMLASPAGSLNSAIALNGFLHGLQQDEIMSLFREDVFETLGYFDYWRWSIRSLTENINNCDLDGSAIVRELIRSGKFCHTVNHPTISTIQIFAREIVKKLGVTIEFDVECVDPLIQHGAWPVYPGIAEIHGLEGNYEFEFDALQENGKRAAISLESFVSGSLNYYKNQTDDGIIAQRFNDNSNYAKIIGMAATKKTKNAGHVYKNLPDSSYWRKSISMKTIDEVDPVSPPRFQLQKSDRIITAGSCFAQHIAKKLTLDGFNYHIAEMPPANMTADEALDRGYGLFSARYGNIYTARQLKQLVERCTGAFTPVDTAWQREDGRYVDPFRPQLEPDGYASQHDVEQAATQHLVAVRSMFAEADYFVFTLGLTECWTSKVDGTAFPIAPGVVAGQMDDKKYGFCNFSTADVVADMKSAIENIRGINPNIKFIFTVSPVPLIATFERAHVLTATTYSKSALRAAVEDIRNTYDFVEYFPSYEIITGNYARSQFYENDLREVNSSGVSKVMGLLQKHYFASDDQNTLAGNEGFSREFARSRAILCDEELLDSGNYNDGHK
jgi:hypothetical protein